MDDGRRSLPASAPASARLFLAQPTEGVEGVEGGDSLLTVPWDRPGSAPGSPAVEGPPAPWSLRGSSSSAHSHAHLQTPSATSPLLHPGFVPLPNSARVSEVGGGGGGGGIEGVDTHHTSASTTGSAALLQKDTGLGHAPSPVSSVAGAATELHTGALGPPPLSARGSAVLTADASPPPSAGGGTAYRAEDSISTAKSVSFLVATEEVLPPASRSGASLGEGASVPTHSARGSTASSSAHQPGAQVTLGTSVIGEGSCVVAAPTLEAQGLDANSVASVASGGVGSLAGSVDAPTSLSSLPEGVESTARVPEPLATLALVSGSLSRSTLGVAQTTSTALVVAGARPSLTVHRAAAVIQVGGWFCGWVTGLLMCAVGVGGGWSRVG
jgi:hypothetical protein